MKQCIFGNHLHYGDPFIEKIPEGVVQCFECAKKHNDQTIYEGENTGRRMGRYGIKYFQGYVDRRGKNPKWFGLKI